MTFSLPSLSYPYDALEPVIDAKTMEIHHTKHHQGYVDKLNKALESHVELQAKSIEDLLRGIENFPEDIRTAVRNNGGGHANHSLFWETLRSPQENNEPEREFKSKLEESFGSFDEFKKVFSDTAASIFGSGWAWLAKGENGELKVYGMPLQDNPLMKNHTPLLGLDVWEHAYYLNYQNRRAEYIDAFWKLVNWKTVQDNLNKTAS